MDSTDYILKMVNENSDYAKIAEYIINSYPNLFEFLEAKDIAKYLVNEHHYTKQDVLSGNADQIILKIATARKMRNLSVAKEKDNVKTPFKTVKKHINKRSIAAALALILSISSLTYVCEQKVSEVKEDKQISKYICMIADDTNIVEGTASNLIAKHAYGIGYGDSHVVAYNTYGIADDIIKVCLKDPSLLDIILYRTYFDMNYNRLENMDSIIHILRYTSQNDENLKFISDSLGNSKTFLDYIISKGYLDENTKHYAKIRTAVQNYNQSTASYPFSSLSEEDQKAIEILIGYYEDGKVELYDEFSSKLENLVAPESPQFPDNSGGRK